MKNAVPFGMRSTYTSAVVSHARFSRFLLTSALSGMTAPN